MIGKRMAHTVLWVLGLLFSTGICEAQQLFSEGVIVYKVTLEPPANQEGITQYSGTYTITVKGKQLKKELKLDNGFTSITIHDESKHTAYTLRDAGSRKYAVQLDNEQLKKNGDKYLISTVKHSSEKQKIAGIEGVKGIVIYKNNTDAEIVYTDAWKPDVFVYDRFPGIEVLPLVFTVNTEEGVILHFRVKKVDATLVENSNFKIPADYKIITHAEYRELK